MEEVYLKPQWMQDDGIHPNRDAQPFIADWMAKQLTPFSLLNHSSCMKAASQENVQSIDTYVTGVNERTGNLKYDGYS